MTGLLIFTEVAMAGCAFLIYFLYALWRDMHKSRSGPRVEIRRLKNFEKETGKLLHFPVIEERGERQRL